MKSFRWLLAVSRPRFWPYLFGPFLIGLAAAMPLNSDSYLFFLILAGLYFTFPANLLIYGVNDIHDYETDKKNPKKQGYEVLVAPTTHRYLKTAIVAFNAPFVVMLLLTTAVSYEAKISLLLFLVAGIGYSAPPIRAKVRPFIDTIFNSLYVFPGLVAYGIVAESLPPLPIFIAATMWCMAMHAYSAIPDIKADRKAHIKTVATILGYKGTLVFCVACYGIAGMLSVSWLGVYSLIFTALYVGLMTLSGLSDENRIFQYYKRFPVINLMVGVILFWIVVLGRS